MSDENKELSRKYEEVQKFDFEVMDNKDTRDSDLLSALTLGGTVRSVRSLYGT